MAKHELTGPTREGFDDYNVRYPHTEMAKLGTPTQANAGDILTPSAKNTSWPGSSEEDLTSIANAMRDDVRMNVERAVAALMRALCIDIENDHNTHGTPARVAKMYVDEVMRGRFYPKPDITAFPNALRLDELYVTGPITVRSMCSHHLVPIVGRCWIGVVPGEDSVIGLSKFNRLVDWVFARPQIQEEASIQLADIIEQEAKPAGLAVLVEATHMCMTWRGVREHMDATMKTSVLRGCLRDKPEARAEFFSMVGQHR